MSICIFCVYLVFFCNDTATTEIYTLSLHDALPIFRMDLDRAIASLPEELRDLCVRLHDRSEEHTSELQSPKDLVCRLVLEKKKSIFAVIVLRKEPCIDGDDNYGQMLK